jgi:hypothetical protein
MALVTLALVSHDKTPWGMISTVVINASVIRVQKGVMNPTLQRSSCTLLPL